MTPREMLDALEQEARRSLRHGYAEVECQHILGVAQWVRELEAEIERHHRDFDRWEQDAVNERKRAEKAEAQVETLREALTESVAWMESVVGTSEPYMRWGENTIHGARAALAEMEEKP